nr:MAG: hypothetical protein DIU74_10865 [Pseudomonadota bacterium]
MLCRRNRWYVNGERVEAEASWQQALRELADRRRLPPGTALEPALLQLLHQWYAAGYLLIGAQA